MIKVKINYGFTLIELLVVISIIGLLASVVLVSLNVQRQKARDAKRLTDMNQVAKAFELYFNTFAYYPTQSAGDALHLINFNPPLVPTYISRLPSAATPPDGSCTAGANTYIFYPGANGLSYGITFCLGSAAGGFSAGVHTLTQSGIR